jgi:glycine dehydrogenase
MIEPTESESKEELDRFCDALIEIRKEIQEVEEGKMPREGNVLKMAPHSQKDLILSENWDSRPYTRQKAAYPLPYLKDKKFWPAVTRLDDGKFYVLSNSHGGKHILTKRQPTAT